MRGRPRWKARDTVPTGLYLASALRHGHDRPQADRQVEAGLVVADVVQVVRELALRVLDAGAVAVADLRPAREPRRDKVAKVVIRDLLGQLADELRPLRARA